MAARYTLALNEEARFPRRRKAPVLRMVNALHATSRLLHHPPVYKVYVALDVLEVLEYGMFPGHV
jgi:hypothetical protein